MVTEIPSCPTCVDKMCTSMTEVCEGSYKAVYAVPVLAIMELCFQHCQCDYFYEH